MFLCPDNSFWKEKKKKKHITLQYWENEEQWAIFSGHCSTGRNSFCFGTRYTGPTKQTHLIWGIKHIYNSEINHAPTLKPELVPISTGGKSGLQDQKQEVPRDTGEAFDVCTLQTDTFTFPSSRPWPPYHNGDFSLADVEVWHVIHTHSLQRTARPAGSTHQEHRGEATWRTRGQNQAATWFPWYSSSQHHYILRMNNKDCVGHRVTGNKHLRN